MLSVVTTIICLFMHSESQNIPDCNAIVWNVGGNGNPIGVCNLGSIRWKLMCEDDGSVSSTYYNTDDCSDAGYGKITNWCSEHNLGACTVYCDKTGTCDTAHSIGYSNSDCTGDVISEGTSIIGGDFGISPWCSDTSKCYDGVKYDCSLEPLSTWSPTSAPTSIVVDSSKCNGIAWYSQTLIPLGVCWEGSDGDSIKFSCSGDVFMESDYDSAGCIGAQSINSPYSVSGPGVCDGIDCSYVVSKKYDSCVPTGTWEETIMVTGYCYNGGIVTVHQIIGHVYIIPMMIVLGRLPKIAQEQPVAMMITMVI
eukprot:CAMPEP_0201579876 /NCGR_PEP_ID=MMETSP0190_2-20130828/27766_1 /ASSEMBLY_ACC=CAM_ASM_000263 /TAXON_ID=37353 /ORGANISM="Rosalina sp." /LENGTH=308 /DNA_ID=CAMNT_0048014935 /DNA_START=41 /DNA_END=965 /DNA_ORIENTATION=+